MLLYILLYYIFYIFCSIYNYIFCSAKYTTLKGNVCLLYEGDRQSFMATSPPRDENLLPFYVWSIINYFQ